MIFEKHDGWYGSLHLGHGDVGIISRNGRRVPSVDWLAREICERAKTNWLGSGRLIFEILVHGAPLFKDLNGILNRTKAPCQAKYAYIRVHDFIPDHNKTLKCHMRWQVAKEVVASLGHNRVHLANFLGSTNKLGNLGEIIAECVWADGGEGVILKRCDSVYAEGKRNSDLMKIKLELSLDLVVVNVLKGDGKYSNTLGSIVCKNKAGNTFTISGMTDDQRRDWWFDPTQIVGKVVEVNAMCMLPNGSLREPRFKAVRYDKNPTEID